jgi:hypothetical protein
MEVAMRYEDTPNQRGGYTRHFYGPDGRETATSGGSYPRQGVGSSILLVLLGAMLGRWLGGGQRPEED